MTELLNKTLLKIKKINYSHLFIYLLLAALSFIFLLPIIKMISTTFMSQSDLLNPEVTWIPKDFTLNNILVAIRVMDYAKSLLTSILYIGVLALLQTIITGLTGFAFVRYNFKFKKALYALIVITFVVPIQLFLIQREITFVAFTDLTSIRMIGTIRPQLLFAILGQGVNSSIIILIFINFFKKVPFDLFEAAAIDGASALQTFWHVTLKISLSTAMVAFMFSFVWHWNDTLITSSFLGDNIKLLNHQLGLFDALFGNRGGNENSINEAYKMAATLITMAPILILYFITQKQFVQGIESSGLTGQ
ncbi:MAG: carbohydrate ABC transporter permease [Acholeplasmataceae bacterium]|nr:carbohydrate ABC transporter permease [Acholeplasmataceae bacterium]